MKLKETLHLNLGTSLIYHVIFFPEMRTKNQKTSR